MLYWEVARRGFRRYSTYRGATLAGCITNTVFGFMLAYIRLALYDQQSTVGGYSRADVATYTWLAQGLLMTIYMWGWWEIALRVRSGDVITDLFRPFDFQAYWLTQDLGRAAYHAVFRGIPPFLLGALVFDLRLPERPVTSLLFATSLVLAVTVSFSLRYIVNLTSFWLIGVTGVGAMASFLWSFLSGFVVPINWFPGWLETIARVLPFAAMAQVPIDVFLEKESAVAAIGFQLAWAVVLLLAGRAVLAAAVRKVVVQGG